MLVSLGQVDGNDMVMRACRKPSGVEEVTVVQIINKGTYFNNKKMKLEILCDVFECEYCSWRDCVKCQEVKPSCCEL